MFAVIRTGGKQYRVAKDDVIAVEKLAGAAGEAVAFTDVLMVGGDGGPELGAPLVDGATVTGEVVEQTRQAKIIVFKKKRRKNHRRTHGHRQLTTLVRITDILTGGARPPAAKRAAARAPAKAAGEAAAAKAAATSAAKAEAAPAAPAGKDDLKQIGGIGPVIENKLNALGITTFAQIAALGADDVARIDAELNFRGRIERENWVAQAARLAGDAKS
jgi:large subunit ribosomal protein L21